MKKFVMAVAISMALAMMVVPAHALEIWETTGLPGADIGLAFGALPPPGLYFVYLEYDATDFHVNGDDGHGIGQFKSMALVEAPSLLWVTGCKFLGADYGVAIAQPFDFTSFRFGTNSTYPGAGVVPGVAITGDQWGTFNTILVPYILSWKLPCDFRVKTSLAIGMDDAWNSPADSLAALKGYNSGLMKFTNPQNGALTEAAGIGSMFFVPEVGFSWLYHGWNLSGDFNYAFSLKDTSLNFQSGDMFSTQWTLSYTCGKWTFGGGAHLMWQVQDDQFVATKGGVYQSQPGSKEVKYLAGPLLGYNFGPCSLMAVLGESIYAQNTLTGTFVEVRLVVPLGNPFTLGGK